MIEDTQSSPVVHYYKHDIIYSDYTFGDNPACSLTFYATWSDSKANAYWDDFSEQEIQNILGMYTTQCTYTGGFGGQTNSMIVRSSISSIGGTTKGIARETKIGTTKGIVGPPGPQTVYIVFDSTPTVTPRFSDNDSFQFTISGTVSGEPRSLNFMACDIQSDTVTEVIGFYIDDQLYFAEEGMTWAQWVNSEYNTSNYYLGDGTHIYGASCMVADTQHNTYVVPTAVIKSEGQYHKVHSGGSAH